MKILLQGWQTPKWSPWCVLANQAKRSEKGTSVDAQSGHHDNLVKNDHYHMLIFLFFLFIFLWFSEVCFEFIIVFKQFKQSKHGISNHSLIITMEIILNKASFCWLKIWERWKLVYFPLNIFGECWKYSKASLDGSGLERKGGLVEIQKRGDLNSVKRLPLGMPAKRIWKHFCMIGKLQDDHLDVFLETMQKDQRV